MSTPIQIGTIRMIPFFHTFEEPQIRAIFPFFMEKEYAEGEPIIVQGKINTRLFFLVKGSVSIFVGENHIVDLNTVGQVFGEMSLAIHAPSTATVRAKETSTFLIFAFEEMRKTVNPQMKDGILKNFYKGTMEILAGKLMDMNKKKT